MKKLIMWQVVVTLITLGVYFAIFLVTGNAQTAGVVAVVVTGVAIGVAAVFAGTAVAVAAVAVATAATGVNVIVAGVAVALVAVALVAAVFAGTELKISRAKAVFAGIIQFTFVFFPIFLTLP